MADQPVQYGTHTTAQPYIGSTPTVRRQGPQPGKLTYPAPNAPQMDCDVPDPVKSPSVPDMVATAQRYANEAHSIAERIAGVLSGGYATCPPDSQPKVPGPVTSELHDLNQMLDGLVSRLYSIATTLGA